jgi:lon-related putative ATP-dependent protease
MLVNPYAWEGLKRALRDREIRILELGSQAGMISTMSLEPEPIPLDIKIVLLGTPLLYYLLREEDEDFAKLFKIRAEFATEMDRTPENESDYALFVKSVVDRNHLPPFDKTAVARLIEHGSRLAEDQEKLTTRLGKITNLIQEAAYWAQKEGLELVTGASVTRAVQEGVYRNNLREEITQEMISQGTVLISVSGQEIGQVNGLSVLSVGDYSFGKPSRITAVSRPGNEGVVNIERQADLSGPIHIKGMLILEGFLGKRFARKNPLNLTASITFEQSYTDIDGDSASAAELYALLSAIAEVPVRQDVAITGSINQHGKIQAVGGINEKIEGFFSTCQEQGLTGTQGVVIPDANIRHLMLTEDVVQAVGEGQFHIWPIRTFEEGVPILTGFEAGEADRDGNYPPETFHFRVEEKLKEYRKLLKKREEED